MKITEVKIGTRLELEVFDDFGEKITPNFSSQLEWADDEDTAVVAAPIFEGNIYPVRIGWKMNVYFISKDDLYKLRARILNRGMKENIAHIKIEILGDIEKIQRREFFRFEYTIPASYRVVESLYDEEKDKEPMKPAATRDLSGGGVCIKLEEQVNINKLVECELDLGDKKKVSFIGKVVRSTKRPEDPKYGYEIGILFKKIENRDKEAIIQFIFQEQRKLRRKGLI